MKLLQINDTHITSQLGRRAPKYPEQILDKWGTAIDIAVEHDCQYIIHTGDVYHSAVVPRRVSDMVMGLLSNASIEHFIYIGNHDLGTGAPHIKGKSINSLQYLANLTMPPKRKILSEGDIVLVNNDWLHKPQELDDLSNNVTIEIAHKDYIPNDAPYEHVKYRDRITDADIVLCGHIHTPHPPKLVNNTWYSNPGSLARTFYFEADFNREVQVAIIDTDKPEPIEYIPIDAKPISDVYIEHDTSTEKHLDDITSELSDVVAQVKNNISPLDWELLLDRIINGNLPDDFDGDDVSNVGEGAEKLKDLIQNVQKDES